MKRLLLLTAIASVLAAGASFSISHWMARRVMPESMNIHEVAWLKSALNLTAAQVAQIEKLQPDFNAAVNRCCRQHCDARFQLSEELAKASPDLTATRACVERMCVAESDSEHATLDHILQVRSVLTPEQQVRYAKLLRDQMCNAGALGMQTP